MKTYLPLIACAIVVASVFLTPIPVAAESTPSQSISPLPLQQGGSDPDEWERLWEQIKSWLEQLALLFAQAPLIGSFIGEILKAIGGANWWCVGAVIVLLILAGLGGGNRN